MKPIEKFKADELERFKQKHPTLPDPESFMRKAGRYSDKTANNLTKLVIRFIQFHGGQAERINTTGRPIDGTKKVKDVIGREYRIGSVTWIPGTGTKGSADVSSTIAGKSVKWEIKMKDQQSPYQKKYQADIERAGGFYFVIHSFNEFYEIYQKYFTQQVPIQ